MSRKPKTAKKKINFGGLKNALSKMKKAGDDIKGWGDKLKDTNEKKKAAAALCESLHLVGSENCFHTQLIIAKSGENILGGPGDQDLIQLQWFRQSSAGSIYKLPGVTGGFFQPSVDDIGQKIVVKCISKLEKKKFGSASYGPVAIDTKLQAKVEKVKDEGKLEVNVTCDKFKNLAEDHVLTLTRDTLSVVAAPVESSQAPLFYCDLSTTIRIKLDPANTRRCELKIADKGETILFNLSDSDRDILAMVLRSWSKECDDEEVIDLNGFAGESDSESVEEIVLSNTPLCTPDVPPRVAQTAKAPPPAPPRVSQVAKVPPVAPPRVSQLAKAPPAAPPRRVAKVETPRVAKPQISQWRKGRASRSAITSGWAHVMSAEEDASMAKKRFLALHTSSIQIYESEDGQKVERVLMLTPTTQIEAVYAEKTIEGSGKFLTVSESFRLTTGARHEVTTTLVRTEGPGECVEWVKLIRDAVRKQVEIEMEVATAGASSESAVAQLRVTKMKIEVLTSQLLSATEALDKAEKLQAKTQQELAMTTEARDALVNSIHITSESKEKALEEQSLSLEQLKQSRAELEEMQARWFRTSDRLRELKLRQTPLEAELKKHKKDLKAQTEKCAALESELESLKQMGEDFTKMESELKDAKTQLAECTDSYEQMRSSIDKLTASRNAYKQKAKSSAKDIQKLLHRVEGSVSASQLGLILAEKEALLKANEQLKTSLAQSELSRIDGSRLAASGGRSKKKGVSLASLQLQNRDLQKLANELFNRLNDADTALSEQRHMNKVLGKQVMNLQERIDVLTKLDEDMNDDLLGDD